MAGVKIHRIVVGPFDTNCILVEDEASKEALVVDPGGGADLISERVRLTGVRPVMVVLTHGHVDHCAEASAIATMYGIPIAMHRDDLLLYQHMDVQVEAFMGPAAATRYRGAQQVMPTVFLEHGQLLKVGRTNARVIHLPGHTMGGIGLLFEGRPDIIVQGDTLFRDGVGRTDLYGGNWEALQSSLKLRLFTLKPDTIVVCGHGGDTTISREKVDISW